MAGQLDSGIIAERLGQEAARLARPEPVGESSAPEAVAVPLAADGGISGRRSDAVMLLARRIARRVPGARRLRDWIVRRRRHS